MLAFRLAVRYFFSTKRFHAVHVVSTISSVTIGVVVMAAVAILSIFNGYEHILLDQVRFLDPPLLIERADKQVFSAEDPSLKALLTKQKGIAHYSFALSTQGVVRSASQQQVAHLYGVDSVFTRVNDLDSVAFVGHFVALPDEYTLGVALYGGLFSSKALQHDGLSIYIPKRQGFINPMLPHTAFRSVSGVAQSVVNVQNEHYDRSLFLDINTLRTLLDYSSHEADRVLLLPQEEVVVERLQKDLQTQLGQEWSVLNRVEQQPDLIRLVAVEKWMAFFILFFVLLLAAFNVVCSSSMLIIEKKRDVEVLSFLGARRKFARQVFLIQGFFVTFSGAFIGLLLGLLLIFLQKHFGWLTYGQGVYEQPYPVAMRALDLCVLLLTLLVVGYVSSLYPVYRLLKKK